MTEDGKFKVLVLSDHALSTSGVGTQTRHLIEGLLAKGSWSFRQFGAALKHNDYNTIVVNSDFIIKPIDGFGDENLIRQTLISEKPDVLFIFTDPRFFTWLFKIEDEIHQVCPIVWWHVWDNYPYPKFNNNFYQSTDTINCHSHMTYTMINEEGTHSDKVNFIPHAIPDNHYFRMTEEARASNKAVLLGKDKKDNFVAIWVNRNAKRKRPADVLLSWKMFLDKLYEKEGHRNATLVMHTEPLDQEGPNLFAVAENLNLGDSVFFSRDRVDFDQMNTLYNISDFCYSLSYAEGFGLSTLESMMTGTPIIAPCTGGLTRQVVDHRDGSHNGVALPIECKTLVGSQSVPYIYEDYVSNETASSAILDFYEKSKVKEFKEELSKKVLSYVAEEFSYQKTIDLWHESMLSSIEAFKTRKNWDNISL